MKEIPLTKGKVALVDDGDYDELMKYSWYANECGHGKELYYARRGGKARISMHNQIMGFPTSQVDHIDKDGLNNQRENLRIGTHAQNLANTGPRGGSSKYKGVYKTETGKWKSVIMVNNKRYSLGHFSDEGEAAIAYDAKAVELLGEFAYLNFPELLAKSE